MSSAALRNGATGTTAIGIATSPIAESLRRLSAALRASPRSRPPACLRDCARNAFIGAALPTPYASNYLPLGLRDIYYDTDDYYYRWGDGYAYRVDRGDNLVAALLPLVGAGLGVGMPFPYQGPSYYVPSPLPVVLSGLRL